MTSKTEKEEVVAKRRYSNTIAFSEEEYGEIKDLAKRLGVYPREAIMLKIRGKA